MSIFKRVVWSLLIAAAVGVMVGASSAVFLRSLELVTRWREGHGWALLLLPLGGFLIGWIYHKFGRAVEGGNNLILEEIHQPKRTIPARLWPLIFGTTLLTHLFGGSAGREGTAVQMGGALADQLTGPLKLDPAHRRKLLMVGMSAGFGSVFGVPLAGTLFGVEVLHAGRKMEFAPLLECLLASFVAHWTCLTLGARHSVYTAPDLPAISLTNLAWVVLAGAIFALAARAFSVSIHALKKMSQRFISYPPLRPAVGGICLLLGYSLLGTTRFAGLGVPVILDSVKEILPTGDFFFKFLFTVLTLGFGFKGGEVTPLLFIGAALGNSLSFVIPLSFSCLASLGLVGVFAGCSKTPWACAIMAMELFGPSIAVWAVLACVVSHFCSGSNGIYGSQAKG